MDGVRLDLVTRVCISCGHNLKIRDRVMVAYTASSLFSAGPEYDVGLFDGGARPLLRHVDCQDPTLKSWKMKPILHSCIRCRNPLKKNDVVQPVFGIESPRTVNPHDPTDVGLSLSDRIYFIHVDCKRTDLTTGSGILVVS